MKLWAVQLITLGNAIRQIAVWRTGENRPEANIVVTAASAVVICKWQVRCAEAFQVIEAKDDSLVRSS